MRLKYFIPFILLVTIGCDSTDESNNAEEPLVHRFDKEADKPKEAPKKVADKNLGYDPEVVPETSYPSIFEVDLNTNEKDSSKTKGKKASKVLNLGKEKIKVYDESMGSVNEASLKKLRNQVK